jgi:hypothetical protein
MGRIAGRGFGRSRLGLSSSSRPEGLYAPPLAHGSIRRTSLYRYRRNSLSSFFGNGIESTGTAETFSGQNPWWRDGLVPESRPYRRALVAATLDGLLADYRSRKLSVSIRYFLIFL